MSEQDGAWGPDGAHFWVPPTGGVITPDTLWWCRVHGEVRQRGKAKEPSALLDHWGINPDVHARTEAALAQAQAERDEAQTGYRIAMDCVGSMEAQLATAQANCDALTAERDALREVLQAIENAGSLVYGQQAECAISMARSTLGALTHTPTATTQQGQE